MLTAFVREVLERMRRDRDTWREAAYEPSRNSNGDQIDLGARTRAAALYGCAYDRRSDDRELCRFLLEHEVRDAEGANLQGLCDTLRLACFLVARARQPEDVWLLCRAKLANYDTYCGLDREYLFAAGRSRVIAYVKASSHPQRARTLSELTDDDGQPAFSDDEITSWWASVDKYFPDNPNDEPPLAVADTALYVGTPAEAMPWFEKWARSPHDPYQRNWAVKVAAKIAKDHSLRPRLEALGFDDVTNN